MNYIEKKVLSLVRKYNQRDPFLLAKKLGINVIENDLGEVFGYYTQINRIKFILINSKLSESEKKFVCSHELGHAILHSKITTPCLMHLKNINNIKIECEANKFAVKLLMDGSHKDYYIEDKFKIMEYYGIPIEMERYIDWYPHLRIFHVITKVIEIKNE